MVTSLFSIMLMVTLKVFMISVQEQATNQNESGDDDLPTLSLHPIQRCCHLCWPPCPRRRQRQQKLRQCWCSRPSGSAVLVADYARPTSPVWPIRPGYVGPPSSEWVRFEVRPRSTRLRSCSPGCGSAPASAWPCTTLWQNKKGGERKRKRDNQIKITQVQKEGHGLQSCL